MLVTQAISREPEVEADALAARTAGAGAFIGGLRGVHGASIAYRYWVRETTPVYADGLTELPEPDDDFMHFMRLPRITDVIRKGMHYELTNPTVDPYDSHPPLAARIAALQRLPPGNDTSHEPLAASLLHPIAAGSAAPSADAPTPAPAAGDGPSAGAGPRGVPLARGPQARPPPPPLAPPPPPPRPPARTP